MDIPYSSDAMKGMRAIVCGASKGIGRATAEMFASCGAEVIGLSRSAPEIPGVKSVKIDLENEDEIQLTISKILEAGPVHILVNNAGAIPGGDIEMVTEEVWREAWNLKVFGYINMCREVYPKMCKRGSGVIFNVVGMAGVGPRANYVAGSVGNAGLDALTVALGSESINFGVRVLGIHPGAIETERLTTIYKQMAQRDLGDENRYKEMYKGLPADRPGTPEECATVAAMLISEKSYWMNGVVIPVNGRGQGW